jgi:serine/threonine protein phosphatase PrpC
MAQPLENFDFVIKNLIELHLVYDNQLKFNHPKLSEIIFDLYTYIKPKGRGTIDSIFTQLTWITVNMMQSKAYIDKNKTNNDEYNRRLQIIIDTTIGNLTKLYPGGMDENLEILKTQLPNTPFVQKLDLILKYLTVSYINYYRLFTKAEGNDLSLSSVRGPVTNLTAIDFTRGPLPQPIPAEIKRPPGAEVRPPVSAIPLQEPGPVRDTVPTDIHSLEKPIIRVYLKAETADLNKIFSGIKERVKSVSPIKGRKNEQLQSTIKVGAAGSANISSFETNRYFAKKISLPVSKSTNNYDLIINGIPNREFKGHLTIIASLLQGSKTIANEFTSDFCIDPAKEPRAEPLAGVKAERTKPSADIDLYDKEPEDTQSYALKSLDKAVLASSLIGRYHIGKGTPREDRFFIRSEPYSGWSVFAVADGAENVRFSRKGAEIASKSICNNFIKYFSNKNVVDFFQNNQENLAEWNKYFTEKYGNNSYFQVNKHRNKFDLDKFVYAVVYRTYMAIHDESVAKSKDSGLKFGVGDYDTTLKFLALKKFPFGYFFISYGLGDGVVVLFDWNKSGRAILSGTPDSTLSDGHNAYITTLSEVSPEKVKIKTFFGFAESFDCIVLATDGVTDPFFTTMADVLSEEKWIDFWKDNFKGGKVGSKGNLSDLSSGATLKDKAEILKKWLRFDSVRDNDDRTILLIR